MNASYSVFYILMSVLLWHNCLSITNWYTTCFTSRTIGQTSGSVNCKCNVMQPKRLVLKQYRSNIPVSRTDYS